MKSLVKGKGNMGESLTLLPHQISSCLTDSPFFVLQVSDQRDVIASHQSENGTISTVSSTVSSVESERATYEFLAQTPIKSTDAHLVEFSEAMRSKETQTFDDLT
jgi:hypothetical protein